MSTAIRVAAPVSLGQKVAGFVALTKPRIIELLLVTTVPTMIVAQQGLPSLGLIVATVLGGTLSAGGANAVNMYVDRDIDAVMQRTRNRPLVTGVVSPPAALVFAVALEVAAFVVLWRFVNLLSALLALGAAAFYVFVYTLWLKRTSTSNIVVGGAAGAVPVLIGWSSVTGTLEAAPWVLFAMMFFWTPPHFWALAVKYKDDYSSVDVPMLPSVAPSRTVAHKIVAYSAVVVALSLVFGPVADLGMVYAASAVVLGGLFMWFALAMLGSDDTKVAMRLFSYSITYVTALFVAMIVDVAVHHGL